MGATVDLERVAPQWSTKYKDQEGKEKNRVATIDVVATIPRCVELQWMDVTIRRSTDTANVEGAAKNGEYATLQGEREQKIRTYGNKNEVGPDTVKPVSFELGGRMGTQMSDALRMLTTKLAEARGGELNATKAIRTLRLKMERTLNRAEADCSTLRLLMRSRWVRGESTEWWDLPLAVAVMAGRTSPLCFSM